MKSFATMCVCVAMLELVKCQEKNHFVAMSFFSSSLGNSTVNLWCTFEGLCQVSRHSFWNTKEGWTKPCRRPTVNAAENSTKESIKPEKPLSPILWRTRRSNNCFMRYAPLTSVPCSWLMCILLLKKKGLKEVSVYLLPLQMICSVCALCFCALTFKKSCVFCLSADCFNSLLIKIEI